MNQIKKLPEDAELDALVEDMLYAIEHGMAGPVRHAGITGQTIEAQMRGSVRQVTEFDLERFRQAADTLTALRAQNAALQAQVGQMRKVTNQCRLAFGGYVDARTAVDMLDALGPEASDAIPLP